MSAESERMMANAPTGELSATPRTDAAVLREPYQVLELLREVVDALERLQRVAVCGDDVALEARLLVLDALRLKALATELEAARQTERVAMMETLKRAGDDSALDLFALTK